MVILPSMGDEKLGEASALRRDVGKEEPCGVLSSAGSKDGSFRASKCHQQKNHGCLDKQVPGRSEILSQELKDMEQKSQFHPSVQTILGMSENGLYPQWNSPIIVGIMISKTIVFFGVHYFQTNHFHLMFISFSCNVTSDGLAAGWLVTCSPSRRRGCWAVPYVYTIYIYIYMLCICISVYIYNYIYIYSIYIYTVYIYIQYILYNTDMI